MAHKMVMTNFAQPQTGSVWISRMTSIFHNLALENWLLRHRPLGNEEILLIWRDDPCVVIGRHQNPWQEADSTYLQRNDVSIARRYSGGGAVYHDHNNVNFSFLTTKKRHSRLRNLQLLADVATRQWKVPLAVNHRHDLILSDRYKVSGTAARLVGDSAYHHMTLLLEADGDRIFQALSPTLPGLSSKATASVRSDVAGLKHLNPSLTYDLVVNDVAHQFLQQYQRRETVTVPFISEVTYPQVLSYLNELQSWEWIYGSTPRFSVTVAHLNLTVTVEKGQVEHTSAARWKPLEGSRFGLELIQSLS